MEYRIEYKKESGEIVLVETFPTELIAQNHFDYLETIKYPMTYKGLTMNLSEYPEGRIGSVHLVVQNDHGKNFERRELFRKP